MVTDPESSNLKYKVYHLSANQVFRVSGRYKGSLFTMVESNLVFWTSQAERRLKTCRDVQRLVPISSWNLIAGAVYRTTPEGKYRLLPTGERCNSSRKYRKASP